MFDLKKLLDGSVESLDFMLLIDDCSVIDESWKGNCLANAIITNHSGLIELEAEIKPAILVTCARCGCEFLYRTPLEIRAKITDKLANEDEDEFIIMQDFAIDPQEIVRSALILELPSRFLCKEDCKGLCSKCGVNLNEVSCDCDHTERDSRWDVLKDYFD